jgi:hypothetical protein
MRRTPLPSLFLLPLILAASPAVGQRSGIGVKGGLLATHTRSGAFTSQYVPGATVGIYAPILGSTRFEIQPEVLLTTLGSGHTSPEGERYSVRTFYAQVPLSAKIYFTNVVNLQVGVQASKLIKAEQNDPEGSTDITGSYDQNEVALLLGAGADLSTGLDLTLRYHNGLTPVLVNDNTLFPRNQAVMLTVGYRVLAFRAPRMPSRRR